MRVLIIFFFLIQLSTSFVIDCEFKNDFIHDWGVRYSCRSKKIVPKGDGRKLEVVSGDHLKGMTRENVTQFFARGLNIERFPQGLGEVFVNIEVIRITSCSMRILLKNDMVILKKLKFLDLVGNKIEKLESDTFELVPNLIHVILNNNRLRFIGSEILKPLKQLEIVSFGGNVCIQSFSNNSKEQMERLKVEILLKCSDISMLDLMKRFDEIEKKLKEISKKIDKEMIQRRIDENMVIEDEGFILKID